MECRGSVSYAGLGCRNGVGIHVLRSSQQKQHSFTYYSDCLDIYVPISYSLMSIFVTSKGDRPTTASDRSSKMILQKGREKSVTPFVCDQKSASSARRRVDQSPLQGALSIAIRKLTCRNGQISPRPQKNQGFPCRKQLTWTQEMEMPSGDNGLNHSQIQNIKNILQEFIESLYCEVEREIYTKFNTEMKRMVIKYRQTESMLKSLQQKLTFNADVLDHQTRIKVKEEHYKCRINELEKQIERISGHLDVEVKERENQSREVGLLRQENQKLTLNVEKYQNILLKQLQQIQYTSQILSRPESQKNYQTTRQNTSFTNLLATKNRSSYQYPYIHPQDLEDSSQIMMTNSQISNVNQLQPSMSPVSIKGGQKARATLQAKKQPVCPEQQLGEGKRRR